MNTTKEELADGEGEVEINFIAKNIELDFINKYSKLYNAKKFYE